ncbi:MAG: DUF4349 domain-containing protein [Candidatus Woesearchaeota archaeon]
MGFKNQLKKVGDNWLLVVLVVIILLVLNGGGSSLYALGSRSVALGGGMTQESSMDYATKGAYYPQPSSDFAPDVTDRQITYTSSLGVDVKRSTFADAANKVHDITKSTDSFILNENVNKYGQGATTYQAGYYQIKVDVKKYDSVLNQLKSIGKVTSFNENALDITGSYTNTAIELQTEKDRLVRYQELYDKAERIEDKLNIEDRIFNQERTVKYLEDRMSNMDKQVSYATISLSITEEQSNFQNIAIRSFGSMVRNLVESINSLLGFIFIILPWAVAAGIIWIVVRVVKRH